MASNRMMQAIGALERAVGRLEQQVDRSRPSAPPPGGIDAAAAREALRSLDALIAEVRGQAHG
ncbi:hypothetical protein [Sphingobium quisquiliarum]|nr:hypothetical protein [Sphingobium quisquiliarum]